MSRMTLRKPPAAPQPPAISTASRDRADSRYAADARGAAVVPAALGAAGLTLIWATVPFWWTYPHADLTATGNLVVGILCLPLFLWGPLTAAVTLSYHRRHRVRRRG